MNTQSTSPGARRRRLTRLLAVLVAVSATAASCGGDDDDDAGEQPAATDAPDSTDAPGATGVPAGTDATNTPTTSGGDSGAGDACTEDRVGGEVTMGTFLATRTLDPAVAGALGSSGGIEHAAFYDTLARYVPETGEYVPHVAESFESNADFTEWTVVLRSGITFGNGDPLTAEATKASFERFRTAPVSGARMLVPITEIEVVDELTLTFHTPGGFTYMPYVLASEVGGVVNVAVADAGGENFGNDPTGAGVGPFEFERFAPGEELVLSAKDDYWGGPVCIETLRFINVVGGQGTYDAFRDGTIQAGFVREANVIGEARDAGVSGLSNVIGAGTTLHLNNAVAPTDDVRVRQAIAHALDLELIDDRYQDGMGLPSGALVPDSFVSSPGVPGPTYDPDLAAQLVEEAKAEGWDGALTLTCGPLQGDLPVVLEGLLEAAGMDVTVEILDTNALIEAIYLNRDFQAGCWAINVFQSAPGWNLSGFRSDSAQSITGYANADMDAALDALDAASTVEEQRAALGQIQEVWNETIPSLNLYSLEEFVMLAPELKGVVLSSQTVTLFHDAYLEQ